MFKCCSSRPKGLAALFLGLVFASPAFGQSLQALLTSFSGRVEVLGASARWVPAEVGMVINPGDTLSTGFHSQAVLTIGLTHVTAGPLTRILLRDLLRTQLGSKPATTTRLGLRIGKINASVKSASGEASDFAVRGPASTASARGTEFSLDVNRNDTLEVLEGTVSLSNDWGQEVSVTAGQVATVTEFVVSDPVPAVTSTDAAFPQAQAGGKLIDALQAQGGALLQDYGTTGSRGVALRSLIPLAPSAPGPTSVLIN